MHNFVNNLFSYIYKAEQHVRCWVRMFSYSPLWKPHGTEDTNKCRKIPQQDTQAGLLWSGVMRNQRHSPACTCGCSDASGNLLRRELHVVCLTYLMTCHPSPTNASLQQRLFSKSRRLSLLCNGRNPQPDKLPLTKCWAQSYRFYTWRRERSSGLCFYPWQSGNHMSSLKLTKPARFSDSPSEASNKPLLLIIALPGPLSAEQAQACLSCQKEIGFSSQVIEQHWHRTERDINKRRAAEKTHLGLYCFRSKTVQCKQGHTLWTPRTPFKWPQSQQAE